MASVPGTCPKGTTTVTPAAITLRRLAYPEVQQGALRPAFTFDGEKEHRTAGPVGLLGLFINGQWKGDVYSNGVEEAENPVSVDAFRKAFIEKVEDAARLRGFID